MEGKNLKTEILEILSHPEAEEGLYFRNFYLLHEEDERPALKIDQVQLLDALQELVEEGRVRMDDSGPEVVFHLVQDQHAHA